MGTQTENVTLSAHPVYGTKGARVENLFQLVTLVHRVIEHSGLNLTYEVENDKRGNQSVFLKKNGEVVGSLCGVPRGEFGGSSFPSRITAHMHYENKVDNPIHDPSMVTPLKSVVSLVANIFTHQLATLLHEPQPEPSMLVCGYCEQEFDANEAVRIRSPEANNPFCSRKCASKDASKRSQE